MPFPTLSCTDAHGDPITINSAEPFPIESSCFRGSALLLLRTPDEPDGPYQRAMFAGKRRIIELQLQGRFTAQPPGPLFVGKFCGESTSIL